MRKNLWLSLMLMAGTTPAVAQHGGTLEFGGFVRYNDYDKSFGTSEKARNSWGGGGRIGVFLNRHWQLELDDTQNATDVKGYFKGFASTALTYYPHHLRIFYNYRFGEDSPLFWMLGLGPAYNHYGKHVPGEPGFKGNDWGAGLSTGLRAMLTGWLAFRVDATLDYIPSPNNGKDAIVNQFRGSRRPRRRPRT